MEKAKLFNIPNAVGMTQEQLSRAIQNWFEKNGTIAFEHGFKAYIVKNGTKWRLTMAVDKGVHLVDDTRKILCYCPYNHFHKQSLLKIMRICEEYYNYCLTEA